MEAVGNIDSLLKCKVGVGSNPRGGGITSAPVKKFIMSSRTNPSGVPSIQQKGENRLYILH